MARPAALVLMAELEDFEAEFLVEPQRHEGPVAPLRARRRRFPARQMRQHHYGVFVTVRLCAGCA